MVRKRDAWTRARDSFRKRRGRPPKAGWLISELSALTGQSPRTIRYYLQQGVLARPAFFGTATRYGREHLLRLLGIERLKREGLRKLSAIRQRLDAAGEAQLLAAVAARPPSAAVAAALGLSTPSAASSTGIASLPSVAALDHGSAAAGEALGPGEPLRRIQLLPGLELLVAENASPVVRQIALQLQAHCVAR